MQYNVSWEVSHHGQENQSGVMPVEAKSEVRAVEMAQHTLEEQFPGEEDYILLECQIRKPGRPRERRGTYERITLEIKPELLAEVDARKPSRRETIETAVTEFLAKEKRMSAGFHPTPEQIDAWADSMLNEATDDMQEQEQEITPFTLSAFFEKEYELPFTPEEAKAWLSQQDWYNK